MLDDRNARVRFPAWPLPLAILALAAFQLHAFGPGVVTPDTVSQWGQALSGRYDDWHPPATAWLWRQLMPLGRAQWPVLVFDALLYWGAVAGLAETLRRRGRGVAAVAVVVVAASPIPLGQGGAVLKDPLLTALLLAAAALGIAAGRARPALRAAAVGAAAIVLGFAAATRFNAVFACAPLLVVLAPARWLASVPRVAATALGAVVLLVAANRGIDQWALAPHGSQPIYSLVNFDFAGIVAQGGANPYPTLDAAAAKAFAAACYSPKMFNPPNLPACNAVEDALLAHVTATQGSVMRLWLDGIARAPLAYARHRLAHLNRNWRWAVPDLPGDAVYAFASPNAFGLDFHPNAATRAVVAGANALAWSPLGRPATWLGVALGLLLVAPHLRDRRWVTALAASALFYGGAYAVVSVAPDLRYNVWTMVASQLALILGARDWRRVPVRSRWLAALPVAVAVAGELAGLALG